MALLYDNGLWNPQQKPLTPVEVDWSDSLSVALTALFLLNGNLQDLANPSRAAVVTPGGSFRNGAQGPMLHLNGIGDAVHGMDPTPPLNGANWTISVYSQWPISTAKATLATGGDGVHYHGYILSGSLVGAHVSTDTAYSPSVSSAITGWHRLTVTNDGTTLTAYMDGGMNGLGTITGTFPANLGVPMNLILGSASGTDAQWGDTSDYFIWNRTLSATEVWQHYASPYQMLRPIARMTYRTPTVVSVLPISALFYHPQINIWDH